MGRYRASRASWADGYPQRGIAAVALVLAAIAVYLPTAPTAAEATPVQAAANYQNPLVNGLTKNPAIVKVGGTYYAYFNGLDFAGSQNVPAYSSPDLVSWTQLSPLNVLPAANTGGWADTTSGTKFTSPSVAEYPSNPAASRYVLYFTGTQASTGNKCIGVAVSAAPSGPFQAAANPLVCPAGGAQDPSVLHGGTNSAQLIYRKNGANPGIYNLSLSPNGQAPSSSRPTPTLLYEANPSWWHQGYVDRPSVAVMGGKYYLFFSGQAAGSSTRAVGWSDCAHYVFLVTSCKQQTNFGSWLAPNAQVTGIGGMQVLKDGSNQWIVYDAGGKMRLDKVCADHEQPRTNGPSTGPQPLTRHADCSADVPGADYSLATVADDRVIGQAPKISYRDGGSTVPVNGRLLWMFSDTFTRSPCHALTNSATLGVPAAGASGPEWTSDSVDSNCPSPFIPYTTEETNYNSTNWSCSPSPSCPGKRIILWEVGAVSQPNGTATAFFWKMIHDADNDGEIKDSNGNIISEDGNNDGYADVGCGLCYEAIGHGLVRVNSASNAADRSASASPTGCNPTCLFTTSDLGGQAGVRRPFLDGGFVYAWMKGTLARAPLADINSKSAWKFWTSSGGFTGTAAQASNVPGLRVGASDVPVGRVDYNPYLDKFVNVAPLDIWTRYKLVVQLADTPEGPWTPAELIYDATPKKCPSDQWSNHHPYGFLSSSALTTNGGRSIFASYARPGPNFGMSPSCPGQMRLLEIKLR